MAAEASLRPAYQMTAQVNRLNPGGAAQTPHRDHHLGFMSGAQMARYPAHVLAISPHLTLQGAVAHCDMSVETGPAMLLPFSQQFFEGYLAFGRPEFQAYFAAHHGQLPLEKGDLLFFNSAVMHGAGTNHTADRFRMVNLLQASSAFGRPMETVNRTAMALAVYSELLANRSLHAATVIAATAESYAFPTNLCSNPPIGGLAPKPQANHMHNALAAGLPLDHLAATLAALQDKDLS